MTTRQQITRNNPPASMMDTSRCAPRLFLILDGAFVSAENAITEAEKRGMRLNIAVSYQTIYKSGTKYNLSMNDLRKAALRGHGMLLHSVGDESNRATAIPRMTDLTSAQRVAEFEARTRLETDLGRPIEYKVYPNSDHNITVDSEGYLRFKRLFAGKWGGDAWRHPFWMPHPVLHGRYGWSSGADHQSVKAELIAAAKANEDIVVYTHNTDGTTGGGISSGVTMSEFVEVLDLAMRLGMRVVSVDEMGDTPPGPIDPSFETITSVTDYFDIIAPTPANVTAEIVTATPATGVPGTKMLRLANSGSSSGNAIILRQKTPIPVHSYILSTSGIVFGGRVRVNRTSGTGGVALGMRYIKNDGTLTTVASEGVLSSFYSTNTWSAAGAWKTTALATDKFDSATSLPYSHVKVEYRLSDMVGEAWIDHVQMAANNSHDLIA